MNLIFPNQHTFFQQKIPATLCDSCPSQFQQKQKYANLLPYTCMDKKHANEMHKQKTNITQFGRLAGCLILLDTRALQDIRLRRRGDEAQLRRAQTLSVSSMQRVKHTRVPGLAGLGAEVAHEIDHFVNVCKRRRSKPNV